MRYIFIYLFVFIFNGCHKTPALECHENAPHIFMRWGDDTRYFSIEATSDFCGFKIGFLNALPSSLTDEECALFQMKSTGKGEVEFVFIYPSIRPSLPEREDEDKGPYALAAPRICTGSTPRKMEGLQDLIPVLESGRFAIYTGAGISVAAGIPGMDQLEELLGVRRDLGFLETIRGFLEHPEQLQQAIEKFFRLSFQNVPTSAHYAIRDLANSKCVHVLTENLDHLHELSGVQPIRIQPREFLDTFSSEDWRRIDYLLCIGLSHDDRGFLSWYKEQNPKGTIISIDLNRTDYLGDEDFWMPADAQEILPRLLN